jgi:group II intron reverse transcriptase/maturase
MATGSRYPGEQIVKVREMRTADTILNIIQDRGTRGLPLDDVYRQLYNPDLYLRAYGRIQENDGAMTPGTTDETVDGMSQAKIAHIIEALRFERWRWTPVRRTYVEKKNSTKKRPLGLPTWSDKLLQEVIRSILEAYYEPQFSEHSHGFRSNKGCHTALTEIHRNWMGTKWFIEGDIKGCFDNIDHTRLMEILREKIRDNRFLRLIEGMLKAGYCEDWSYHPSLSGTPQGGVVSPILANIYLDRLDQFVEKTLIPEYTRGTRRTHSKAYLRLSSLSRDHREKGHHERAKELRKEAQKLPAVDPNDPEYRRLRYTRYADDCLWGLAGPKAEAEEIKEKLSQFLGTELQLTLAAEKTLVTHATNGRARFLGYEIGMMQCQTKHDTTGKRTVNGKVGLYIPEDIIRNKRQKFLRNGTVMHRSELENDSEYDIIYRYQWEYRGLAEYYAMAQNLFRLGHLKWTMETSLLKTLAHKNRTTVNANSRRLRSTWQTRYGPRKCLQLTIPREGKKPLVAVFGGLSLKRRTFVVIKDQTIMPYIPRRSEIVDRLLNDACEVCGAKGNVEMHHIRKMADLKRPGQREKPLWMQIMIARRRKTIAVCRTCHMDIQHNRPRSKK